MYFDIFFSNPNGEIIEDPTPPVDGVLIDFPGNKEAVVYAVKDFGGKRLHCLVTTEQLDQIESDNVPFKFVDVADSCFKAQPGAGEDTKPWHGQAPAHVFNPAGVCSRKAGVKWIHRVKATDEVELG